jgi:lipopolysaccharide transport system ATP-binding protein
MKPILEIQSLSKKYRIQHLAGGYLSLRERMASVFRAGKSQTEDFWALKDVSFEVNAGESIGIIGRNGAGKSTLLKILSKITPPTKGKIISRGRIASLLEVGTGFHPELTGRENIFFNGSLLGMKRMEIAAKFDEIVDFSGVEKFLDTPLKHYSSGMQLRLAFAVAAFLEPEILIIDEVLAVGDAEFQKKCMRKMDEVSKNGRTILFVSHNMGAIESLCKRGIVLSTGKVGFVGTVSDAVNHYLHDKEKSYNSTMPYLIDLSKHPNKKYNRAFGLQNALIKVNGKNTNTVGSGDTIEIEFTYLLQKEIINPMLGIVIKDAQAQPVIGVNNKHTAEKIFNKGLSGKINFKLKNFAAYGNGEYAVDLFFGEGGDDFDVIYDAFSLELYPADSFKTGVFINPAVNKIYQPDVSFSETY